VDQLPAKISNPFKKTSQQIVLLGMFSMLLSYLLPENSYLMALKFMLPVVLVMLGYLLLYLGQKHQKVYPKLLETKVMWWPVDQTNMDEQIHVDIKFRHQEAIKNGSYFLVAGIVLPLLTDASIEVSLGIGATLFLLVVALSFALKRAVISGLQEKNDFVLISEDGLHIPGLTISWKEDKGFVESIHLADDDTDRLFLEFEMYFPGFNRFTGEYLREQRARVPVPQQKRDELRAWINQLNLELPQSGYGKIE
jgi:hypothetical protein